jgi:hypothetical protein
MIWIVEYWDFNMLIVFVKHTPEMSLIYQRLITEKVFRKVLNMLQWPANCVGFQALIQYQSRQSALSAIDALQVGGLVGACTCMFLESCFQSFFFFLKVKLFSEFVLIKFSKFWNLLCREEMYMMAAVSWIFSFQSKCYHINVKSLAQQVWLSVLY